ncbi:helicase-associated domain-containing protein [Streptomyces sp. NPDC093109]|uniref:helicase-associated domain-containing protein n=1 Tax=Streptomyces sp. NPDC093109 TaxID=3154977 RepID=UPI00344C6ACD
MREPAPRSLGEAAERMGRLESVVLVLPLLPRPVLQTTEALAALGTPAPVGALEKLLGVPVDRGPLASVLRTLADHALVWPAPDGRLRMVSALHQWWTSPLGLEARLGALLSDKSSEELRRITESLGLGAGRTRQERLDRILEHHRDPARVREVADSAPEGVRTLLYGQAAGSTPPVAASGGGARYADERWATDRALLVRRHYGSRAALPAEVTLALRGPDWRAPFDPLPPKPDLRPLTAAEVEREAAAVAAELTGHAAALLAECARRPPARLRTGGIGPRELVRLTKAAQCPEDVARLVLACAYAAGLLARDGETLPVTGAYDEWAEREPAEQLVRLLRAWWTLGRTPTHAHDAEGRPRPALDTAPPSAECVRDRHALLAAAARLPVTHGVREPAALGRLVSWHRPLAATHPQDRTPFAALVREAGLFGVLARGALSPLGAALRATGPGESRRSGGNDTSGDAAGGSGGGTAGGPGGLAECARRLLPSALDRARIGADLTAVVPGVPSARLAGVLDSVAVREARGTASVWRFGPDSVRGALDGGRSAEEITAELAAVAEADALPQPLVYLIADTARRHGQVRVAGAGCVIHGVQPALLTEIASHRRLSRLGIRPLAPSVLLSGLPLEETLTALRAEGYAPVAEESDGTARAERQAQPRARPGAGAGSGAGEGAAGRAVRARAGAVPRPRDGRPRAGSSPAVPDLAELAALLLAAAHDPLDGAPYLSRTEETLAHRCPPRLSRTELRRLAAALEEESPVTIEYADDAGDSDDSGGRTVYLLREPFLDPPELIGRCPGEPGERSFSLARIRSVPPT